MPQEQTGEGRKLACVPRDPGLVSRKAAFPKNGRARRKGIVRFRKCRGRLCARRPSLALKWVFGGGLLVAETGRGLFRLRRFGGRQGPSCMWASYGLKLGKGPGYLSAPER